MDEFRTWYDALAKPVWTPSAQFIGTVWTILYPLIAVAFIAAISKAVRGEVPKAVYLAVAINTVANIAFTPIQFGLRNLPLAAVDIIVVLATIVWLMVLLWQPGAKWIVLLLVPYLVWVSVATVLQTSITWMNR